MKRYEPHPYAGLFPALSEEDMNDLIADIRQNGLQRPITLHEGMVLDGVHRQAACLTSGVRPHYETYTGRDPLGFVVSANVHRRHLDAGQRAIIAAKLAALKHGGDRKSGDTAVSRDDAARLLQVSPRSVDAAARVLAVAPVLAKAVSEGQTSLRAAERQTRQDNQPSKPLSDKLGRPVPDDIAKDWREAEQIGARLRAMSAEIKLTVERGLADKAPAFAELCNAVVHEAASLHYSLSQIVPYAICPVCHGHTRQTCQLCRKRGFISKFLWNSPAVPERVRRMIAQTAPPASGGA